MISHSSAKRYKCKMYADDTVIFTHARTAELAAEKLNVAMERIAQWLDKSCLTLNTGKTKGMFFSKMKACSSKADIFINGEKIEIVTEFNYLGLTLDSNLSFKKHVKKLVRTIKHRLCLPTDVAKTFIHATIFSHLSYCLTCWGQAGETVIKPLKSLYKQTLKTLDKKSNQYHHCRVLEKYNFLSFDNFRLF